jgi:hypothetical protein
VGVGNNVAGARSGAEQSVLYGSGSALWGVGMFKGTLTSLVSPFIEAGIDLTEGQQFETGVANSSIP